MVTAYPMSEKFPAMYLAAASMDLGWLAFLSPMSFCRTSVCFSMRAPRVRGVSFPPEENMGRNVQEERPVDSSRNLEDRTAEGCMRGIMALQGFNIMQFTGNLGCQGDLHVVWQDAPGIGFHLQVRLRAFAAPEEIMRFQDEVFRAFQGWFR